jgi:hypothetical protein
MSKQASKAEMALALLDVMEFCRDELRIGALTPRLEHNFIRLRDCCDRLLGEPTHADAHRIRQAAQAIDTEEQVC